MAQINLGVALNFDDSQYKSGVKSVEQSLKKFSTTPAFVKLKLDDTDFRKQYQGILADLQKKVQKTGALNYKTTKGKAKVADSIGTIQAAYKYNLEQSQNTKLSTAEINTYKKREEVLRNYLNLLKLVGEETKRNAQLEKERANMGVRMEKARMTGKVAAERQRAYKAEFADEKEAKKADELFRRRWAHEFKQWDKNDAELAKLQREADARARAAAGEYNRQLNRVARGGNTSGELADMRRYYQEQESLAAQSSRRQEQLKNITKYKDKYTNALATGDFKQQKESVDGLIKSLEKYFEYLQKSGNTNEADNIKSEIESWKQKKQEIEAVIEAEKREEKQRKSQTAADHIKDNIDELEKKRLANKNLYDNSAKTIGARQRFLNSEHSTVTKLIGAWEAYKKKMIDAGAESGVVDDINSRIAALKKEEQQLYTERGRLKEDGEITKEYTKQSGLLGKLGSLASRYFSAYSVINFAKSVAETTGYFEQQQVALEGIFRSATKASSVLNDIKEFALSSPFQTKDLVQFTKQLSAFGVGAEEVFPKVKELADISTGLGVDMSRIILAYGQVKSAYVLRGQELRQFTEAGIPMVEELAKRFTQMNGELVTTADIFEMISKRQVSFEVVSDVLSDMTKEGGKFYKMQENITETLYGQIQKLKDLWTLSMNDIGKTTGGLITKIVKLLQFAVSNVTTIAVALAGAFAGNWAAKAIVSFARLGKSARAYIRLLRVIASMKQALAGGIIGIAAGAITGAIVHAISEARKLKKALDEVSESFRKETERLIDGLNSLTKKITSAKVGTKEYADAVSTLSQNYSSFISSDIIDALNSQGQAAREAANGFALIAESVKDAIKEYQKYLELEEQKKVAGTSVWNNKLGRQFARNFDPDQLRPGTITSIKKYFDELYGDNISYDEAWSELIEAFQSAVQEWGESGDTSETKFNELFKEELELFNLTSEQISAASKAAWLAIENNLRTQAALKEIDKINAKIDASDYAQLTKEFSSVDIGKEVLYDKESTSFQRNIEARYIKALDASLDTFETKFGTEIPQGIVDIISNAFKTDENGRVYATNALEANTTERLIELLTAEKNKLNADPNNPNALEAKMANWLDMLIKQFKDNTEQRSERAADVYNKMLANAYLNSDDEAIRGLWKRYLPTNENYDQLREGLVAEYNELKGKLDSYPDLASIKKDTNHKDYKTVTLLEEQIEILKVLASPDYFYIKLEKDKNTKPKAEQVPVEVTDFINEMKTAYTRYKEAAQKGGVDLGVDFVKNDEYFKENFKQFFSGISGLGEYGDLKIGDKTIRTLFEDLFIQSGVENGFVDFEKGLTALADQLDAHSKDDNGNLIKTRKAYAAAAKALYDWINSTFSKDRLSSALKAFDKEVKTLTASFKQTSEAVELYRKLQEKGTEEYFASKLGVSSEDAYTPDSKRIAGNIATMVTTLQKTFKDFAIDDITTISGIDAALTKLNNLTELNSEAFSATDLGKNAEGLKGLLVELKTAIVQELQNISANAFTGNTTSDLIANSNKELLKAAKQAVAIRKRAEEHPYEVKDENGNVIGTKVVQDTSGTKALVEAMNKQTEEYFDNFMKSNQLDVIANAGRINMKEWEKLEKAFDDLLLAVPDNIRKGLERKKVDLKKAVDDYNATVGGASLFGDAVTRYRKADKTAKEEYDKTQRRVEMIEISGPLKDIIGSISSYNFNQSNDSLKKSLEINSDVIKQVLAGTISNIGLGGGISIEVTDEIKDVLARYKDTGFSFNPEEVESMAKMTNLTPEEAELLKAELLQCKLALEAMGVDGEILAKAIKKASMENLQKSIQSFQSKFNSIVESVNAIISAFKSLSDSIRKVYDMWSKGEEPEWMKDMDSFINDFSESFEALIAPMVSIISLVATLTVAFTACAAAMTPMLIVMAVLIAAAAIVAGVMAAVNVVDNRLQRTIEDLEKQIENTQNAITNLDAEAHRLVGFEKLNNQLQSVAKSYEIYIAEMQKANAEAAKPHKFDQEKYNEYIQNATEAYNEFLNKIHDIREELVFSVTDLAQRLADAMREAFQNGSNAARAMAATVKETIGDMIHNMITNFILAPRLQGVMEEFFGGSEKQLQEQFTKEDGTIDYEKLGEYLSGRIDNPENLKKMEEGVAKVSDETLDWYDTLSEILKEYYSSTGESSSLSGGIEGISEDTARSLEGLMNSMLIQQIQANQHLTHLTSSAFANVQTSWFNDMLAQTRLIQTATSEMNQAIKDMRSGVRPISVTIAN